MSSNVKFEYLHRDASNYKFWNSIVFTNPSKIGLEEAIERIYNALDSQELFIAHQIHIPEVFPFLNCAPTEHDHCFHEFASIESTTEDPDDTYGRSLGMFIQELEDAAHHGWRTFDPRYLV